MKYTYLLSAYVYNTKDAPVVQISKSPYRDLNKRASGMEIWTTGASFVL